MHGLVFRTCRVPKDKHKYWLGHDGYVFVEDGFFKIRNFWSPAPVGLVLSTHQLFYFYALYNIFTYQLWTSWMIQSVLIFWAALSTTGGAHRLYAHRSYDGSTMLKIFYLLGFSISGQGTMASWAGGHRIHHKYSDTDADPHNCKRGFIFCHLGWMFTPEHPDVQAKHKLFTYDDLNQDKVLAFQARNYFKIFFTMAIFLPIMIDIYLTGNSLLTSFSIVVSLRVISLSHIIMFINSAAHMFGDRPYDPKIDARQNPTTSIFALGEGYHNYHHSYPYDYRTAEDGMTFNSTAWFIDACAKLGLARNLKTASQKSIDSKKIKTAQVKYGFDINLLNDYVKDNNNVIMKNHLGKFSQTG